MSDLKVGDKVYIKPDFYKNNKPLVECTVTKIGSKYFYAKGYSSTARFQLDKKWRGAWWQDQGYALAYPSKEHFAEIIESKRLIGRMIGRLNELDRSSETSDIGALKAAAALLGAV